MSHSELFQILTDVLEDIEERDVDVDSVKPQKETLLSGDQLDITAAVRVPLLDSLAETERAEFSLSEANTTEDGDIVVDIDIRVQETDASRDGVFDNGSSESILQPTDSDAEFKGCPSPAAATPPHHDPDQLASAYESCDTFVEMTEMLGVDVTPETVRQQMIKHDIHDPNPVRSTAQREETSPPAKTNGSAATDNASDPSGDSLSVAQESLAEIDLPVNVTADDLIEAVKEADTIHEVADILGIKRDEARAILGELDLYDMVLGRVSTGSSQVSREEVVARLQKTAT